MRAGQRKACQVVIKGRRLPSRGRVTCSAVMVEVIRLMIGVGCTCVSFRMATIAVARCTGIACTVAGLTLQRTMRTG